MTVDDARGDSRDNVALPMDGRGWKVTEPGLCLVPPDPVPRSRKSRRRGGRTEKNPMCVASA